MHQILMIRRLLRSGVDVHHCDHDGGTALYWACAQGCAEVLPTLWLGQLISYTDISQYCFPVHFLVRVLVYWNVPGTADFR
jgi:hypothetical protein